MLLSGCGDYSAEMSQQNGLIYCAEGSPSSFNPQLDTSGTTVDASSHQLYDRLLDFDTQTGRIIPGLASSWLISSDGLTYTFQLRKNVPFHSTAYFTPSRTFNADDVIFSVDRWRLSHHPYHEISGGNYPYFNSLGLKDVIKSVKRVNGYRIRITLHRPDSSFLANLATDFAIILSAEYAEQLLDQGMPERIDTFPIGTGPFKFISYRKDRFIRFEKHENYWKHPFAPEQLIYDITTSSSLRLAKLLTGECDAIAFPSQSELNLIEQDEKLSLDVKSGLNVGFWAFNTARPPFNNPDVRKALAMAIDKNTLLEAVYFDRAVVAKSILPPSSWAYQEEGKEMSYNPVLARKLLRENGIEEGFGMNIWAMPVERAYNPNARKMAELIQSYLKDVGIDANIVSYEWSTFRQRLKLGLHDSVLIGWTADNGDPDNFYRPLLSCSAILSGTNRAMWCSPEYDKLINDAVRYSDPQERIDLYHKASDLLYEQMPLVPIAHAYRYQAYRKALSGFEINPYGGVRFGEVEMSK
ncbi:ABC transporter substrate-binding protein [Aestuariibacter sp. AA17]|uniref:ABC transporter substrate-binding protein n=1 Tax=Fluctibacter corallii TaxID=2984329 RepID=A0ABT3A436_9ALTE|nr:ABC transporter substrate-binding protein [Aestuariibacter sp. AA17]MCV2883156.1 ABC transporter substrate-binding protein [Aestuariibacter sp. AA17]